MTARARRFAPSPLLTIATLSGCALFAGLGFWQWQRGLQRQEVWARFARGAQQRLDLGAHAPGSVPLFQRVTVSGTLDGAHQFLLDNRTHGGRAGYEVLTPLMRPGSAALLIDRGWVPFTGSRTRLPDVVLVAAGEVRLSGRIAELPSAGLASGRAAPDARAPWPKVTSYPSAPQLAAALGVPVAARILLLDPQQPYGYLRDWQPPGMTPLRHLAYAIQWWSFAALALVLWVVMGRRRARPARAR